MHACALQIGPCSPLLSRRKQEARDCECMNKATGESQPELTEAHRYQAAARAAQIKFQETGKLPENIYLTHSGSFQVQVYFSGTTKTKVFHTLYEALQERDRLKAEQKVHKHTLPYEKRNALEEGFDKFCKKSIKNDEDNDDDNDVDDETAYVEACADGTFCVRVCVLRDEFSNACEVLGDRWDAQDKARTQLQKLKLVQRYRFEARKARKAFDNTKTLPKNIFLLPSGSLLVQVRVGVKKRVQTVNTFYDALRERDRLKVEQQAHKHILPREKREALEKEFDAFCDKHIQANGINNDDDDDDVHGDETAYVEACADGTFCVRVRVLQDEFSDACEVLGGRWTAQDEARTQLQKLKLVQRYHFEARKARKAYMKTKTLPENIYLHHGSFQVSVMIAGKQHQPTFHMLYDALRKRDVLKLERQAQGGSGRKRSRRSQARGQEAEENSTNAKLAKSVDSVNLCE